MGFLITHIHLPSIPYCQRRLTKFKLTLTSQRCVNALESVIIATKTNFFSAKVKLVQPQGLLSPVVTHR